MRADEIKRLENGGAKVKRTPKAPAVKAPEPKVETPIQFPHYPEIPDYGKELKVLIHTLDNRLNKTRVPWRIIVNRSRSGLAESYDVIPLERGE